MVRVGLWLWVPMVMAAGLHASARADTSEAAKPAVQTWAVVSMLSDDVKVVSDLLTATLEREQGLRVLDRDNVQAVLAERELKLATGADCRELGRILQADVLVTLELVGSEHNWLIRITMIDTRWGARLLLREVPCRHQGQQAVADELAEQARQTRGRFAGGVRRVVAVPPLISRGFLHEYDNLQVTFARWLEIGLYGHDGVAVVAGEEALAVQRELALSMGEGVSRPALWVVEGQFDVTPAVADVPATVTFSISRRIPGSSAQVLEDRTVRLDQAREHLVNVVAPALMATPAPAAATSQVASKSAESAPAQQEFEALVARADMLARKADLVGSTGLREAALLVKDDAPTRAKLVDEYVCLLQEGWGGISYNGPDPTPQGARRRAQWWSAALGHVEHIVRNRQTTDVKATQLAGSVIPILNYVYIVKGVEFEALERSRRRFLRETYPLLLALPPEGPDSLMPNVVWYESLMNCLYDQHGRVAREGCGTFAPQRRLDPAEMDLVADVLTQVLPANFDPLPPMLDIMRGFIHYSSDEHFPLAEFRRMAATLRASDRPMARVLGGLTDLEYRMETTPKEQWNTAAMLREVDDIEAQAKAAIAAGVNLPWMGRGRPGPDYDSYRVRLGQPASRPAVTKVRRPVPAPPPPLAQPTEGGSVVVSPLEGVNVRLLNGQIVPLRSNEAFPCQGIILWCRGDDRTDLAISRSYGQERVLIMRTKDLFEEVLAHKDSHCVSLAWDGRFIWMCMSNGELWAICPDRKELVKVNAEQGLPAADRGSLHVQPVGPGEVIAAGVFGPLGRGWIARVSFDGTTASVNLFFKAIAPLENAHDAAPEDPHQRGFGTIEFLGEQPGTGDRQQRLLLKVLGDRVLQIDPQTLSVEQRDCHLEQYECVLATPEGLFLTMGYDVFAMPDPLALRPWIKVATHPAGSWEVSSLCRHDGWVYACRGEWLRIDPVTLAVQGLGKDAVRHMVSLNSSAHYGLIAVINHQHVTGPTIRQIQIVPADRPPGGATTAPAPVATQAISGPVGP